ncbi:hypothetical protein D3C84_1237790 [compost metagenome]
MSKNLKDFAISHLDHTFFTIHSQIQIWRCNLRVSTLSQIQKLRMDLYPPPFIAFIEGSLTVLFL